MILLLACAADPTDAEVFDAVWADFDAYYGPFEQRGIDWDGAYERWQPEVSGEDGLWTALTGMLAELDDGHVMLAAPGRELFESNAVFRDKIDDDAFDLDVVEEHYLSEAHAVDDAYLYGLVGDVPYLYLPGIGDNLAIVDEVVDTWPDAPAMIIDLRHSLGGDFAWAFTELGRFTGEDVDVFRSRTRDGPDRDDFAPWMTWALPARGETFAGRVVLLTDRYTISASERATMALQAIPGTVTVGVPTNGSEATLIGREASNRWTFSLPVQEVERVDGEVFEGVGIPVDIEVLSTPEALAKGTDAMLEAAIEAAEP